MRGRDFLELAREIVGLGAERHWRGTHIHAYYALLLECRDTLIRWSFAAPPRHAVHGEVRLRLVYSTDADVKVIGMALDRLSRRRNWASYDLQPHATFGNESFARRSIQDAADALSLLVAIDADPARRAAAIAAVRP
jgi:hypothetical protein